MKTSGETRSRENRRLFARWTAWAAGGSGAPALRLFRSFIWVSGVAAVIVVLVAVRGLPARWETALLITVVAALVVVSATMYVAMRAVMAGQAAIHESEEKYRELFSADPDAIVIFDARTRRITDVNAAAVNTYGYAREEFLKMNVEDLFVEPVEAHDRIDRVAEGQLPGLSLCYHRRKGGGSFPVELAAGCYSLRGVQALFAVVTDITGRKRAENALRREIERAQGYLDVAGVILVAIDADQKVSLINRKGCEVLGYREDEILGRNWFDCFVPEKIRGDVKTAFAQLMTGKIEPVEHFENPVVDRAGRERLIAWYNAVLRDENGRIVGTLSSGEDITERQKAQKALARRAAELAAANTELEAFAHTVSHDLRSPLRSMDGFSQLLLEDYQDQLDEQGKDYLNRIRVASQHMGELIDDLLDLSRVTRIEMRREPVDLSALARAVAADLRQADSRRQVEWVIQDGLVDEADRRLVEIALRHLLENAWKFTSKRPAATVAFGARDVEGKRTYFVEDNGAGFDKKYAAKLFGVFHRLHAKEDFPGTGIGLVTVKRIIDRHGGRVWAESEMDRGATFYFTLE